MCEVINYSFDEPPDGIQFNDMAASSTTTTTTTAPIISTNQLNTDRQIYNSETNTQYPYDILAQQQQQQRQLLDTFYEVPNNSDNDGKDEEEDNELMRTSTRKEIFCDKKRLASFVGISSESPQGDGQDYDDGAVANDGQMGTDGVEGEEEEEEEDEALLCGKALQFFAEEFSSDEDDDEDEEDDNENDDDIGCENTDEDGMRKDKDVKTSEEKVGEDGGETGAQKTMESDVSIEKDEAGRLSSTSSTKDGQRGAKTGRKTASPQKRPSTSSPSCHWGSNAEAAITKLIEKELSEIPCTCSHLLHATSDQVGLRLAEQQERLGRDELTQ